MATLFINACIRGEESRTLKLCREYLATLDDVTEVNLDRLALVPLDREKVAYRSQLQKAKVFDDAIFDLAKQFAAADSIVIGAPYWDLSFPAALKTYIEYISVCDITFGYSPEGIPTGLCKAGMLSYITTCGGSLEGANYGYEYICAIAKMFGIENTRMAAAEMLDVIGQDVEANMDAARAQIAAWNN